VKARLLSVVAVAVGLAGCGSSAGGAGPATVGRLPAADLVGVAALTGGRVIVGADQVPVGGIPTACATPLPVFHGYLIHGRLGGSFAGPVTLFRRLVAVTATGGGAAVLGSMIEPVGSGPRCDAGPALGVARIAADGTTGVARVLSATAPAVGIALAGDPAGDVGAAWLTDGSPTNFSRTTVARAGDSRVPSG
jgi:hypothetical protein